MARLIPLIMIIMIISVVGIGIVPVQRIDAQGERAEVFINRDLEIISKPSEGNSLFTFSASITIINYKSENIELKFPSSCTFKIGVNVSFVDSRLRAERKHEDVCAPVETKVIIKPGQNNFSVVGSILILDWADRILPDGKYVLFVTQDSYTTPTESDYSILDPEIFDNYGVILLVNNGKYSFEFDVSLGCPCAYNPNNNTADQSITFSSLLLGFLGLAVIMRVKPSDSFRGKR